MVNNGYLMVKLSLIGGILMDSMGQFSVDMGELMVNID